jgi:hypothetical protein
MIRKRMRTSDMPRILLLVLALVSGCLGGDRKYAGPASLGAFRIDHDTDLRALLAKLGPPASADGDYFCYESKDPRSFFWIARMAHQPHVAGDVLLSDFPNCTRMHPQVTSEGLRSWQADKGIVLGSTEEDVIKAYGKPTRQDNIERGLYRWVVHGDKASTTRNPELGSRVLVYQGAHNDLSTAEFGIRNGKVAWIFLSINE